MSVDPQSRQIRRIIEREIDPARRGVALLEYVARQTEEQRLACASVLIMELTALQALLSQLKKRGAAA